MPEKWDVLKDTVRQVEETRPGIPSEKAEDFVADTAGKVLEMLPDLKLPIPPPPWLLPDMTPTEIPPVCTPGATKCVGFDSYECSPERKWVLVEANSPSCGWAPGQAEFELSDLLIEPTIVNVGEPVSISVLVTNIGGKAGTKTVMLEVT